MADSTRQRRREIALRIALGAQGWRVIREVLAEGARLAAIDTVAGLVGSIALVWWLARVAPNAEVPAAWSWLAALVGILAAVVIASVLPARRALGVDPLTIIRDQ